MANAVTLLPLPLSPTRATVSCASTVKPTPSTTAARGRRRPEGDGEVFDFQQRHEEESFPCGSTVQNTVMTGHLDIEAYNSGPYDGSGARDEKGKAMLGPLGEGVLDVRDFSALCGGRGKFGVAISTRPMAVGTRCPFVKPGLGVVVTMAVTDPRLGPLGLRLLGLGYSAAKTLEEIAVSDPHIEHRQISVIDRDGNAVARTGRGQSRLVGPFLRTRR